jgi:hypothetical protein
MSQPTRPEPPDRIQLVDRRDRVEVSLALARAVATRRDSIERCVRKSGLERPGRIAATLLLEKGVVTTSDVSAPDDLASCTAIALTDLDLGDVEIGGTFECAAGYGIDAPARPRFDAEVSREGVAIAGNDRIDAALVEVQRPPAGELYGQLSKHRFSGDGGRYSALRIGDGASGVLIVRAVEAIAAADIEVATIEARRDDRWVAIAALDRIPQPRLSRVAGQAAAPVVILENGSLWTGVGRGHHELEIEVGQLAALDRQLAAFHALPGLEHRDDVTIGIGAEVNGAEVNAIIERVARSGFDQIELVSAETARARLAR